MVFEIETLQTQTFLVKHRVNVSSLRAALEQVRDQAAEELQRKHIEDGEVVESLEYVYFKEPVTFFAD
ncbi:MAG: hypothetical protein HC853_02165 [Anaerolineae bacterium]|nr:hypothetical protein [Anaerolineae bacterium]